MQNVTISRQPKTPALWHNVSSWCCLQFWHHCGGKQCESFQWAHFWRGNFLSHLSLWRKRDTSELSVAAYFIPLRVSVVAGVFGRMHLILNPAVHCSDRRKGRDILCILDPICWRKRSEKDGTLSFHLNQTQWNNLLMLLTYMFCLDLMPEYSSFQAILKRCNMLNEWMN